jgi:hypothetical protein
MATTEISSKPVAANQQFGHEEAKFGLNYAFVLMVAVPIMVLVPFHLRWLGRFLYASTHIPDNVPFQQEQLYRAFGLRVFQFVGRYLFLIVSSPSILASVIGLVKSKNRSVRVISLASLGLVILLGIIWILWWEWFGSGWATASVDEW